MKLYKTKAIVLRSHRLKDADRLLILYSPDYGKVKAMAYGVGKPKSRKRGAVQPFCYSSFLLYKGRELDSVSQCEGIEAFLKIKSDLDRVAYASYVVELVERFTLEGEANKALFRLLLYTLYHFERGGDESFLRIFEAKLIKILGYLPILDECVNCGVDSESGGFYFSPALGGALCAQCRAEDKKSMAVSKGLLKILSLLFTWDPVKLQKLKIGEKNGRELEKVLYTYITYILEGQARSVKFIREIASPTYGSKGE